MTATVQGGCCLKCWTPWELDTNTHTVTFNPGLKSWSSVTAIAYSDGAHEWLCPTFVNPVTVRADGTVIAATCGVAEYVEAA